MKLLKLCIAATIAAIFLSANPAVAAPLTTTTLINKDTIIVPDTIRMSFESTYPGATNTTWSRYAPMEDEYMDTYPEMMMDTSAFGVNYRWNDVDYMSWYSPTGEWMKTISTIQDADLPDPVTSVLRDKYEGYTITKVDEDTYSDGKKYEIKLEKENEKVKIHITPEGEILKLKEKQ